jgi:hypothetical protein
LADFYYRSPLDSYRSHLSFQCTHPTSLDQLGKTKTNPRIFSDYKGIKECPKPPCYKDPKMLKVSKYSAESNTSENKEQKGGKIRANKQGH